MLKRKVVIFISVLLLIVIGVIIAMNFYMQRQISKTTTELGSALDKSSKEDVAESLINLANNVKIT